MSRTVSLVHFIWLIPVVFFSFTSFHTYQIILCQLSALNIHHSFTQCSKLTCFTNPHNCLYSPGRGPDLLCSSVFIFSFFRVVCGSRYASFSIVLETSLALYHNRFVVIEHAVFAVVIATDLCGVSVLNVIYVNMSHS